jgi:Ser/Thr protein kinase RdoA (MazF antagonist)
MATLTAWTCHDPFAWMAREVAVASYAARQGAPIVPPTSRADSGPHRKNGFVLSLWTYLPPGGQRANTLATGEALALLHQALTGCPEALPLPSPIREQIDEGLAALERERVVEHEQVTVLRSRHKQVLADLDEVKGTIGVLHGDAHPATS